MLKFFKKQGFTKKTARNINFNKNKNLAYFDSNRFLHKKKQRSKLYVAMRLKTHLARLGNSTFIWYVLLVSFVFLLGIFLVRLVNVNKITCRTVELKNCDLAIVEVLSKYENSKLYSSYGLIFSQLKKEPSIAEFKVDFDLFNFGWIVTIAPKKASFAITNADLKLFSILSEDGYVISVDDSNDLSLPFIIVEADLPEKGMILDKSILFALSIVRDIQILYNVDNGFLTADGLVIELDSKKRVLFPLEGDRQVLVGGFMYILSRLNSQSGITKQERDLLQSAFEIDMRFENPVLRPFLR
ncbi:MAG: hypothetical protein NZM26_02885 [Patescibacteria group bacterium]|nr:hypothetical protein [Patescibacteria group bacterium]